MAQYTQCREVAAVEDVGNSIEKIAELMNRSRQKEIAQEKRIEREPKNEYQQMRERSAANAAEALNMISIYLDSCFLVRKDCSNDVSASAKDG